jgi:hypothetical protein
MISRWRKIDVHARVFDVWRNGLDGAAELRRIDPLGSWANSGEGKSFTQPTTIRQATDSSARIAASMKEEGNRMINIKVPSFFTSARRSSFSLGEP